MTTTTKPRNGIGGWIALALICLGGSTGGTYLRPPPPHNPNITTEAWVAMIQDMKFVREHLFALELKVAGLADRLPQQAPHKQP